MKTEKQITADLLKFFTDGWTNEIDEYVDENLDYFENCEHEIHKQIYELSMSMYEDQNMDRLLAHLYCVDNQVCRKP